MKNSVLAFALIATLAVVGRADEPPSASKFYRLHFVVQEVDGAKVLNSREYDTSAASNSRSSCSIRTDSRVNLPVGLSQSQTFQNYSLDVKIDARELREVSAGLALQVEAVINSLSQDPVLNSGTDHGPIMRSNSWTATLLIPTRKQVVIFSSDDVTSKHKMQMLLTATPMN